MPVLSSKAIRTGLTFALSFGLGKGAAFCAALAIPRLVDARLYGVVELALTVGALGASILGLGAPSVAVKSYLIDKDPQARPMLVAYCLWLAAIGLAAAAGLAALGYGAEYICGATMIGLFGFQSSTAAYARMRGHIHLSGWFDNSSMLLTFLLISLLVLAGGAGRGNFAWALAAATAAIGIGTLATFVRLPMGDLKALVRRVVTVGTPMMFFSVSMLLIFGTSRIAIAKALTLADVACFSLCARIGLMLVFASQILTTGLFRTVYQLGNEEVARVFTLWIVVLSGIALLLTVGGHFAAPLLVAGTNIPAVSFAAVFPPVAIQMTLWVLNSNLELFVVRDLLARQAAVACVVIAALAFAAGLAMAGFGVLGLMSIINLYSLAMLVLLLTQMKLLSRQGVRFRSAYFALPLVATPSLILLLP